MRHLVVNFLIKLNYFSSSYRGGNGNANGNKVAFSKERKKFVTFTVDLMSEGQPLGMTLASDTSSETPGPIYISAVTPGNFF